jgi:hypothetical protein
LIHFFSNLTIYTTVIIYLLIFEAESIFSA